MRNCDKVLYAMNKVYGEGWPSVPHEVLLADKKVHEWLKRMSTPLWRLLND